MKIISNSEYSEYSELRRASIENSKNIEEIKRLNSLLSDYEKTIAGECVPSGYCRYCEYGIKIEFEELPPWVNVSRGIFYKSSNAFYFCSKICHCKSFKSIVEDDE